MWTTPKLQTFSAISRDIAQVLFASVFVGPIVIGDIQLFKLISGILLSGAFWIISLIAVDQNH